MDEKQPKKLTKWLDQLQQESWQLELLVSGFAIFLAVGALESLDGLDFIQEVEASGLRQKGAALILGYIVLASACVFILVNLMLHVLLRGMWISTLGLRYVSGGIDYEKLKLAPRFEHFLRRRIGTFDQYILQLENICSVVFAFTFLIVFMLVSFLMFFLVVLALIHFVENDALGLLGQSGSKLLARTLVIFLCLSALLYFIDFVTLGWLKRVRWFSRIYFPIYRFYSFITLASLYRPIYYNLIDNKFGRRVGFLLLPYLFIVIFVGSFKIESHVWYPDEPGEMAIIKDHYDDFRGEGRRVFMGSIPSKFVKNGYLELFINYRPIEDDKALALLCPDSKPEKEAGFGTDMNFSVSMNGTEDAESVWTPESSLACLSELYELRVDDSLFQSPDFKFYQHRNAGEKGLLTILDLNYLQRGKHAVSLKKHMLETEDERDTLLMLDQFTIPFWVE